MVSSSLILIFMFCRNLYKTKSFKRSFFETKQDFKNLKKFLYRKYV